LINVLHFGIFDGLGNCESVMDCTVLCLYLESSDVGRVRLTEQIKECHWVIDTIKNLDHIV